MPFGARACSFMNTTRPSSSVALYASLMSPPWTGSRLTTRMLEEAATRTLADVEHALEVGAATGIRIGNLGVRRRVGIERAEQANRRQRAGCGIGAIRGRET